MARYYAVTTERFGEVVKTDDNIAAARKWARAAFGPAAVVRPTWSSRSCPGCNSAPCAAGCRRRSRRSS